MDVPAHPGSFPATHFYEGFAFQRPKWMFQRSKAAFQRPIFNEGFAFQRPDWMFQRSKAAFQRSIFYEGFPFQRCGQMFQRPRVLSSAPSALWLGAPVLLGLTEDLRSRCEELVKRRGQRIPK